MAARQINRQEFQKWITEGRSFLVDYWAPWCGYCRRIAPAYDRVADQQDGILDVVKINIDDEPLLAEQQKIEVIPTLIFYRDGKAVGSVVAPESKAAIDAFIRENMA